MAAAAGWVEPQVYPALYRKGVDDVLGVIGSSDSEAMLLVGHEPTWSATVSALTGASVSMVTAAVVAIDVPGRPGRGTTGSLVWMLTPHLVAGRPPW